MPLSEAYATLYSDGELAFSATDEVDEGREVRASGRAEDAVTGDSEFRRSCRDFTKTIASLCDIAVPEDMADARSLFLGFSQLTDISGLARWDTSKVTDMEVVFYGCSSLEDVSALSSWDTSKVERVDGMFAGTKVTTYPEWYKA